MKGMGNMTDQKPLYYDGSGLLRQESKRSSCGEIKITPEMRRYLGCNPYSWADIKKK